MKAEGVSLQSDSQWLEQSRKCRNIITAQFGARRVTLAGQQYQDKVSNKGKEVNDTKGWCPGHCVLESSWGSCTLRMIHSEASGSCFYIRKDKPRAEEETKDAFRLTRQVLEIYKQAKIKLYMLQHALTFLENSNTAIRLSAFCK